MNKETPESSPPNISPADTALAELAAMRTAHDAFKDLPLDSIGRCLHWLSSAFGVGISSTSSRTTARPEGKSSTPATVAIEEMSDLPTFFAAAQPEVQTDKALVVAYWLQKVKQNEDLDSQQINSELKHLGHGVLNITRALDVLIGSRPALMIQTRKDGTSKQARKRYKVTVEGANRVSALINQPKE